MAKVQVLPQVLAHQIAAGEVVERPASVVKELVENALDAAATRILVSVEEGGKQSIRVTDDGGGMAREDATLAFEHHATSKISSFDDLLQISSLGFRGEALPSIASVARISLKTIAHEVGKGSSTEGTQILYEGGELKSIRDISWPNGTEMLVEDLFFNVPARRKFLKTVATELSHVSRQVMSYALANPQVEFRLDHKGKGLIEATVVSDPRERVFQLLGESLARNLVVLDYEGEGVRIHGFTSLPHEQRNNANSVHLYVNKRMVRDRVLTHAIRLAYRDLVPSSAFPVTVLFVDINPYEIDVNVHPTKSEIRFRNSHKVHSAVFSAIEQALLLHQNNLSSLARDIPLTKATDSRQGQSSRGVRGSVEKYLQRSPERSLDFSAYRRNGPYASQGGHLGLNYLEASTPHSFGQHSEGSSGALIGPTVSYQKDPHLDEIPETAYLSPIPVVLGQFVESFIVAADREGILLVDQHIAHERILYDSALRSLESEHKVATQRLLIPTTVELTAPQRALSEEILDQLNANGFEVEWFGKDTLVVKGVPSFAGETDAQGLVESLLEEVIRLDEIRTDQRASEGNMRRLREQIAISVSCRTAIKINTPLNHAKMQRLLDRLFSCKNPYTCPHGRPIILRLNIEEILRGFKRI